MVRTENTVSKRVYAYRRIAASPEKQAEQAELSYLYIGNRFRQAVEMHAGFAVTHLLFSFDEAQKRLNRLKKAGSLPSLILIDGEFSVSQIRVFVNWVRTNEELSEMPVLIEVARCTPRQIEMLSAERGITDLVQIDSNQVLVHKAMFYNKLQKDEQAVRQNLNEGFNWQLMSQYGLVRLFDVVFASISMMLLSPLMLVVAGLVRLEAGNNIFDYTTERGLRYRTFRYIRFRTEPCLQEDQLPDLCHLNQYIRGQEPARFGAAGATGPIGIFLKRTGLDQLPALFNILTGDMSFIRNR